MSYNFSNLITIKNQNWLDRQRLAGKCVAECLANFSKMIRNQIPNLSLLDIEKECERIIAAHGCIPTFKGYKGFPGAVCLSVNKQLVHGIPVNYTLQVGDVVTLDLGATYQGAIADAAYTAIYGKPKMLRHADLVESTQLALRRGIEAVAVGRQLGVIGFAIHKTATSRGYGSVEKYGGHGLDENMPHAPPFVANKAKKDEGIRLQAGMTLAIEPMLVIGNNRTRTTSDGWTVITDDIGAHMEHSIFIHPDRVEILTEFDPNLP
jgi:methionyl aminopeptidase